MKFDLAQGQGKVILSHAVTMWESKYLAVKLNKNQPDAHQS
jgi:hypothetical protein